MAHILRRLGQSALLPTKGELGEILSPPVIKFEDAMKLREQFYRDGLKWPYEHIVPGNPQPPPGAALYLERRKQKQEKRLERQKEIAAAMAKMPKLIEEYKASRKLNWDEVSLIDKLTLSQGQIKEKYIRRNGQCVGGETCIGQQRMMALAVRPSCHWLLLIDSQCTFRPSSYKV
ncbi:hypothetical protein CEUSTIGMA_g10671.t1 [Chlamydomonas eustigma]|uniref:Uncharacterized protein n=1 Tax=Chlamydomonas eustigma TaxID=1157962 RepID=A0A250XJI3_9CHLO|nr:hypothetical protein CEUSTIGMA_g10671.t1 [Chlamydomonas eustigma]|eukprot:GAX83245.1 hypothetical protein CEUSTIGMA_g10671.t1 [Chlamydomonas eustigma]